MFFVNNGCLESAIFVLARSWGTEILIPRAFFRRMGVVIIYSIWNRRFRKYTFFIKERVSGERHFRRSKKLRYRNSYPSDLFTSNVSGYVFSRYEIADFEKRFVFFVRKRVSGERHFRHSQKLGYRNSYPSESFTSNGSGYVFFHMKS